MGCFLLLVCLGAKVEKGERKGFVIGRDDDVSDDVSFLC